jgi:predicted nuclease with TOPRIM domain
MDFSRLGEHNFIEAINEDKNRYIDLYANYFDTNDLNEIKMKLKTMTSEEKQSDKFKNLLDSLNEIKSEYDNLADRINLTSYEIPISTKYENLLNNNQIVNMKWDEIKHTYPNEIKLINTLSKDFNKNEFKDMLEYAKIYKKTYFIVDKLVYDSINVQGIDLGKNNYYIKF